MPPFCLLIQIQVDSDIFDIHSLYASSEIQFLITLSEGCTVLADFEDVFVPAGLRPFLKS